MFGKTFRVTTAFLLAAMSAMTCGSPADAAANASGAPANASGVAAMLIVAVHSDDEMTLSHLWTGRPGVRKVFLWLDGVENGGALTVDPESNAPIRWNPGEYDPLQYPGGFSNGQFRGSILNLQALRAADSSLPVMSHDRPTKVFTRPASATTSARTVTTWMDRYRGGAIRYNLTNREVTALNTRNAIYDVTRNPAKYGLPANLRWTDIVSSNYYNSTGGTTSACDGYANPQHRVANLGVERYAYPQFSGDKFIAICKLDRFRVTGYGTVNAAVKRVGYAVPNGSIATYFGWLYRNRPPITTTQSGVFAQTQRYAKAPAKAGRAGP